MFFFKAINTGLIIDAVRMFNSIIALYFAIFLFCYFGDDVTYRFGNVGDSIYQLKWYNYSLELQQCLPMMISISRKPVYLKGFASIQCTCEMFKKVRCHFGSLVKLIDNKLFFLIFLYLKDYQHRIFCLHIAASI